MQIHTPTVVQGGGGEGGEGGGGGGNPSPGSFYVAVI